jgi:predicted nucleotidyltransferase
VQIGKICCFTLPGHAPDGHSALADAGLLPAVVALAKALKRAGARHMLIGGVAVVARGVRRLTDDVDAVIWAEGLDVERLLDHLAKEHVVPRIGDAISFAHRNQVLLLRHETSGIDIDLSLGWLPFERQALSRASKIRVGRLNVAVARPDDLIVYKAIAARDRDRADIERLLQIHRRAIDLERVRRIVGELAAALEDPELVVDFERIVRNVSARAAATARKKPRKRRRGTG